MLRSVPRPLEPLPTIKTAHGPIAIAIVAESRVFRVKTTYPNGIPGDLSPELPDRATAYRLAYGSLYRLQFSTRGTLAGPGWLAGLGGIPCHACGDRTVPRWSWYVETEDGRRRAYCETCGADLAGFTPPPFAPLEINEISERAANAVYPARFAP